MSRMNFLLNEELAPFVSKLDNSYYTEIYALCERAKKQAMKLQGLETQASASSYVNQCVKITNDVLQYVENKKQHFIPYVTMLAEKKADGHDCRNCSGAGCSLQHEIQMKELTHWHTQVKDILSKLQMVSLPLYSDTIYPDMYRVLRNNMALLENSLGELFMLEEAYLIPKIIEAQTQIHVHS